MNIWKGTPPLKKTKQKSKKNKQHISQFFSKVKRKKKEKNSPLLGGPIWRFSDGNRCGEESSADPQIDGF